VGRWRGNVKERWVVEGGGGMERKKGRRGSEGEDNTKGMRAN
jgi:hypothetical protein